MKKYVSEFIGTFVLTLFGCGVATFTLGGATGLQGSFAGVLAIAMAFGLSIVAMAYAIGDISGCHINPAVSLGMLLTKRMTVNEFIYYVISQCLGGIAGAAVLEGIFMSTKESSKIAQIGIGCNGYGEASMWGVNVGGALIVEIILTFVFVFVILNVTAKAKNSTIAGIVIGLTLTFVHLLGIPLTGTSVNPARSLGPALISMIFNGNTVPMGQLWVFIVAPIVGSALAAWVYNYLCTEN